MTDQPQTQPESTESVPFKALARLSDQLLEAKLDDETVGFIIGKMMADLSNKATAVIADTLGQEKMDELAKVEDEAERMQQVDAAFSAKMGLTISEYQEDLAEQMVKEYEALA